MTSGGTPHAIQIRQGSHKTLGGFNQRGRNAVQRFVVAAQPILPLLCIATHKRVQRSEQTNQQQRQLPLFRRGIDAPATAAEPGGLQPCRHTWCALNAVAVSSISAREMRASAAVSRQVSTTDSTSSTMFRACVDDNP